MRLVLLLVTTLAVGAAAGRRRAPVVETNVRPPTRGHFGWGMPMDDSPKEEVLKDDVKEVSNKKVKKEKKLPECTEFHRRWHLPCCEHCEDVEKAFDSLE